MPFGDAYGRVESNNRFLTVKGKVKGIMADGRQAVSEETGLAIRDGLSNRTESELALTIGAMQGIQARAKYVETTAKSLMLDRMDASDSYAISLDGVDYGRITRTQGGAEGKYEVKDPQAYAQWLLKHDREADVEMTPTPIRQACEPGMLAHMIEVELKGELPDGVAYKPPTAAQVKAQLDKPALDGRLFSPEGVDVMARMLAITPSVDGGDSGESGDKAMDALGL